jgi:hypothetical protein
VESSCEFDIEPWGFIKCWETIEWPNKVASRVVLSSIESVSYAVCIRTHRDLADCCGILINK